MDWQSWILSLRNNGVCRLLDIFIVSGFLLSIWIFILNPMQVGLNSPSVVFLFIFCEIHKKLSCEFLPRRFLWPKFPLGIGQSIAAARKFPLRIPSDQVGRPSYPRPQNFPKSIFLKTDFARRLKRWWKYIVATYHFFNQKSHIWRYVTFKIIQFPTGFGVRSDLKRPTNWFLYFFKQKSRLCPIYVRYRFSFYKEAQFRR